MKSLIRSLALLAVAPVAAFAINTYNIFTDIDGVIQFYQPGGLVEFTNSYVFEAGVFAPGTNFNNPAQIAANFKSFASATSGQVTTTWDGDLIGPGQGAASLSYSFDEVSSTYANGIIAGNQLAIWAYDTKNITASTDWVILTNPSWIVQPLAVGASVDSRDYTITDVGTTALLGSFAGQKVITTPVPEPSTYAALVGMVVLGAAALRRKRRSA